MWHLLPSQVSVAAFFGQKSDGMWDFLESMGAKREHLVPSRKSQAQKRARKEREEAPQPDAAIAGLPIEGGEPQPISLTFGQFMGTPKLLLATLAWMAGVRRQRVEMQNAVKGIVDRICDILPGTMALCSLPVTEGKMSGMAALTLIRDLGLEALWDKKDVHLRPPTLSALREIGLETHWLVWMVFRHNRKSAVVADFCKSLIDDLSNGLEEALPGVASSTVPTCRMPADMRESVESVRKALRGDDKSFLAFNAFLARGPGSDAAGMTLLKDFVYASSFKKFNHIHAQALAARYLVKVRSQVTLYLSDAPEILIDSDYVLFDASRVASKEVLLVHVFVAGVYACAPLQILPDQPLVHDKEAAMANVQQVLTQTSSKKARRRLGEATLSMFVGLAQAMLAVLPFPDLTAWRPSSSVLQGPDAKRVRHGEGQQYHWDQQARTSQWDLPDELGPRALHGTHVRVLVLVADEGSTGWSLYQYLASYLKYRVLFVRDPPHRISNLFTNALATVRPVLASTLQVLLVHKFRRAPYGGGKHWKGLRETLEAFLGDAAGGHPLLELLGPSIADDHRQPYHCTEQVVELLKSMLRVPMGPKVEMRRWFTFWDAGWTLDKLWHSMLLALIVWYGMNGEDAWEARPSHVSGHYLVFYAVPRLAFGFAWASGQWGGKDRFSFAIKRFRYRRLSQVAKEITPAVDADGKNEVNNFKFRQQADRGLKRLLYCSCRACWFSSTGGIPLGSLLDWFGALPLAIPGAPGAHGPHEPAHLALHVDMLQEDQARASSLH